MNFKSNCPLCKALMNEKDKFLYEDEYAVILPTKNMKGHRKRIMVVTKKHNVNEESSIAKLIIEKFIGFCKIYFDEEPTFALCEPTYASIKDHWHRIACDWNGTEKEIEQLHYTPHVAIQTELRWQPGVN